MTFPKRVRRPATREAPVLSQCQDLLRLRKVFFFRCNNTGVRRVDRNGREFWAFHGSKGVADLICVLPKHSRKPGVILAVETKGRGGKLSEDQIAFLVNLEAQGGEWLACDDVVQLDEFLTDLGV